MISYFLRTNAPAIVVGFSCAVLTVSLAACPSSPQPAPVVVDVGAYTAEQLACVEAEPTDACRADREACKKRIDQCRADVQRRFGR